MNINSKLMLLGLSLFLFIAAPSTSHAQGRLAAKIAAKLAAKNAAKGGGKSKSKAGKSGAVYAKDFEDAKGISGTYFALDGIEYKSEMGSMRKQKTLKVQYVDKKDGEFLQEITFYYNKAGGNYSFRRHGKMSKKYGHSVYRYTSFQSLWVIELEKGLFMAVANKSTHKDTILGDELVGDIFAKDAAQLEVYDMEVAKAKWQQIVNKGKSGEVAKLQKKMMTYKAYKENVGKVTFASHYAKYNYRYSNKPTEDPKNFIKSASIADGSLYLGSYVKTPLGSLCGTDCEFNYVYEMNGKKVSRVELRNSAPNWSKNVGRLNKSYDYFNVYKTVDGDGLDYAYLYLIYQNKDEFMYGKSYKLTVKVYSNRDQNDEELMAEGSIQLKYDPKFQAQFDKKMRWVEEILEE